MKKPFTPRAVEPFRRPARPTPWNGTVRMAAIIAFDERGELPADPNLRAFVEAWGAQRNRIRARFRQLMSAALREHRSTGRLPESHEVRDEVKSYLERRSKRRRKKKQKKRRTG